MRLRRLLAALIGPTLTAAWPVPAGAEEVAVDLELVLAVDVSGSIDREEARLQRDGYLAALVDPKVIQAIRSGPLGRIAIAYVEWAGDAYQRTHFHVHVRALHTQSSDSHRNAPAPMRLRSYIVLRGVSHD